MTDKVIVRRTITEHTNGRKKDTESPTGWVRRAGTEKKLMPTIRKVRGKVQYEERDVTVWEPCEAPRTGDYLEEHEKEDGIHGGTVGTVYEWPEDIPQEASALLGSAISYEDWKTIVGSVLAARSHVPMKFLGVQTEESLQQRTDEEHSFDGLLGRLGVDIESLRRYDRI